jgi:hypothetical protein
MPESTNNASASTPKATAPKARTTKAAPKKTAAPKASAKKATTATPKNEDVVEQAVEMAKGAAYTAVGFGIMAFGKAQVTAREVREAITKNTSDMANREWVDGQVEKISETVKTNARKVDHRVESVIHDVEKRVEVYERQLPGKTRDLVQRARTTGQDARGKVRAKVFAA